MGEYNRKLFIRSFAERTLDNLKEIYRIHQNGARDVYEVTQLINSLFGLLIVPFEFIKPFKGDGGDAAANNYYAKTEEFLLKDLEAYKDILELISSLKKGYRYYNSYEFDETHEEIEVLLFLEHIRNSLAHGGDNGISFYPVSADENERHPISSIIFRDKDTSDKNSIFVAELSVGGNIDINCNLSNSENELGRLVIDLIKIYRAIEEKDKYENEFIKELNKSKKYLMENMVGKEVIVDTDPLGKKYIKEIDGVHVDDGNEGEHEYPVVLALETKESPKEYKGAVISIANYYNNNRDDSYEYLQIIVGPRKLLKLIPTEDLKKWIKRDVTIRYDEQEKTSIVERRNGEIIPENDRPRALIIEGDYGRKNKINRVALEWYIEEDTGVKYILTAKEDWKMSRPNTNRRR